MCLRWRSRSSITRTAGITPAIKAETTTTTTKPRRRCFLRGTPVTQPCVTTSRPAGEIWAEKAKSQDLFEVRQTSRNVKETTSCLLHRCHHQYVYGPSRTYGHIPPLSALPGHDYDQPLLPGNPESMQFSEPPPQYFGPPQSSCQSTNPGLVPVSAAGPGVVWQYGGQQNSLSIADESNTRNVNPAKEFSIRIISV